MNGGFQVPGGARISQLPIRPAGQTSTATAAPAVTPAAPTTTTDTSGRIAGIDGMLDQIAEAMAKQAGPMIKQDILPVLQNDRNMQRTIGAAAGRAIRGPLWLIGGSLAVVAGVMLWRALSEDDRVRANPSRRIHRRSLRRGRYKGLAHG